MKAAALKKTTRKSSKKPSNINRQLEDALQYENVRKASDVMPLNPELGQVLKAREEFNEALRRYTTVNKNRVLTADDPLWNVLEKTCKRCGSKGTVSALFGIRKVRGKPIPQGWCRPCRASKAAHPTRYA